LYAVTSRDATLAEEESIQETTDPAEIEVAKESFKEAFAHADMHGLRRVLRRVPQLAPAKRRKRYSLDGSSTQEAKGKGKIRWYYSEKWRAKVSEVVLPYGGNLHEAMKARDRDAIRAIMRAKATPAPRIGAGAAEDSLSPDDEVNWVLFEPSVEDVLRLLAMTARAHW